MEYTCKDLIKVSLCRPILLNTYVVHFLLCTISCLVHRGNTGMIMTSIDYSTATLHKLATAYLQAPERQIGYCTPMKTVAYNKFNNNT